MTNAILVLVGCAMFLVGLAFIWWPLALVAGGGMLVIGGFLGEWVATRSTEDTDDATE